MNVFLITITYTLDLEIWPPRFVHVTNVQVLCKNQLDMCTDRGCMIKKLKFTLTQTLLGRSRNFLVSQSKSTESKSLNFYTNTADFSGNISLGHFNSTHVRFRGKH